MSRFFLPNGKLKWKAMRYLIVNEGGKLEYYYQIRDMLGRKIADIYDGNFYGDDTIDKRVSLIAKVPEMEYENEVLKNK